MTLLGEAWPVFGWTDDMRSVLADARRHDRTVALATIVALEGSAPRQVGTQMVFDGAQASGHFSSGCIEADIANHAAAVVRSGEPALLRYGRNSPWIDIRLVCGAGMEPLRNWKRSHPILGQPSPSRYTSRKSNMGCC